MIINGTEILPGERKLIRIEMEELPTHTVIEMPVWVFRAKKEGPCLLITAGMHGDETNGTEIIRRMVRAQSIVPEAGTVIAVPVVNIYGFIHRTRSLPDGRDLNRSFPGSKKGSLARRLAYTLISEILPHADLGLDLHTGGANRTNYPQVRCDLRKPYLLELAEAFGAPFIVHSNPIANSFRKVAGDQNKPVLVYEAGESMRLDEQAIEEGQKGISRLLHHLNLRSEGPPAEISIQLDTRRWVRAPISGMFRSLVKSGEKVKKGQPLGSISDPFGEREEWILSKEDAYVIGRNNDSVIHAGGALFHLGWQKPEKSGEVPLSPVD